MRLSFTEWLNRTIASLCYITMGFVAFIWLLVSFFRKSPMNPFLQYHIFQSIFISIAFFLLNMICGFALNILSYIPLINKLVAWLTFLLNAPLIGPYSLIQAVVFLLILYLAFTSFMGAYSRVIWVSDIIDHNIGRR